MLGYPYSYSNDLFPAPKSESSPSRGTEAPLLSLGLVLSLFSCLSLGSASVIWGLECLFSLPPRAERQSQRKFQVVTSPDPGSQTQVGRLQVGPVSLFAKGRAPGPNNFWGEQDLEPRC